MSEIYKTFTELLKSKTPFVLVTMVETLGSIPQNQGAKMIVSTDGLISGTIGGGKVEKKSIEESLKLLSKSENFNRCRFVRWNLNKDVGMTCGGTVGIFFEAFNHNNWEITVFGAGHIANSLIPVLLTLDCNITCIDIRSEWLEKLPESPKLTKILTEDFVSEVKNIKENSFVLIMTMGHTTDKPVLEEILRTRNFPYIGLIGSKAKAKILKNDLKDAGFSEDFEEKYFCPVGLDIGSNDPGEIAISITAQLLQERDKIKNK